MVINRELILKHKFVYFGDKLEWIYIDVDKPNTNVKFEIKDSGGNIKDTINSTTNNYGIVECSKNITKEYLPTGLYYLVSTCNGNSLFESFEVSYAGVLIAKGLETLLQGFQKIPVYDEVGINFTENNLKLARFTYSNWIYGEKTYFRGNNNDFNLYTDIYPLYNQGIAILKNQNIDITEDVYASYKFPFFNEIQFFSYLKLALDEINATPPVTEYSFDNYPVAFDSFLVMKAYTYCLKQLLLDIEFWNNRVIFPEPPGIRGTLNTLLSSAQTELNTLKTQVKGRWLVSPASISSYRITVPYTIDNINYRLYTIASITGLGAGGLGPY